MVVLGLGLGAVMQVLVLAVQNAVDYRNMGVATSGSLLFRQIGGSIGIAIFGAIFANRLHAGARARPAARRAAAEDREPLGRPRTCRRAVHEALRARRRGRAPSGVRRRVGRSPALLSPDVAPARGAAARLDAAARAARSSRRGLRRGRTGRRGGALLLRVSEHETVELDDRAGWRRLARARTTRAAPGVWLVTWKKPTGKPRVDYDAAVEEALCFGWVDSKSRSVDDERTSLYFTPRKPKSAWSASNVARIEKLDAGRPDARGGPPRRRGGEAGRKRGRR